IGLLLATAAVSAVGLFGETALEDGGWRVPFLISIVLVLIGLFIRLKVSEPPAFTRVKQRNEQARIPLFEVIRRHPRMTLLGMGARVSESVTFNVYNAFVVTYTVEVLKLQKHVAFDSLLVAAAVGFVVVLAAGRLSDR